MSTGLKPAARPWLVMRWPQVKPHLQLPRPQHLRLKTQHLRLRPRRQQRQPLLVRRGWFVISKPIKPICTLQQTMERRLPAPSTKAIS